MFIIPEEIRQICLNIKKYYFGVVLASALVAGTIFTSGARAASWYVNNNSTVGDSFTYTAGSDLTGIGTPLLPYRTIGKAMTSAAAGDTIFVDRGNFGEAVALNKDSITLVGMNSGRTIIDPPGDSLTGGVYAIEATNVSGIAIRTLGVTDAFEGIRWNNVDRSAIRDVDAGFNGSAGIELLNGSDSNLISDDTSRFNLSDGILIQKSSGGVDHSNNNALINNTVLSNGGNGIFLFYGASGNRIIRNVIKSDSGDGIKIDGGGVPNSANNNVILQNTVDANGGFQISIRDQANANEAHRNNDDPSAANPDQAVFTNSAGSGDFRRNWWKTTDELVIRSRIAGSAADQVIFIPYRLGVVDTSMNGDTIAPAPPDTITTNALAIGQITVSWSNPLRDEDSTPRTGFGGVKVYRLKNRPDTTQWAANLAWIAGPVDTSWADTGVTPGKTYYYRLTSRDTATFVNESFFSDTVVAVARDTGAWYVNDTSTTGDSYTYAFGYDTQPGSREFPFRTIGRALDSAATGETIYIDRGIYGEAVVILKDAISLIGMSAAATVIDPPGDSASNNVFGINAVNHTKLLVRNLRVTGAGGGILFDDKVSYSTIEGVEASYNGEFGVKFKGGSTFNTVRDDTLAFNVQDGMIFAKGGGSDPVENNTLINNVIASNQRHGVFMEQGSNVTQTRLIRNTIKQNGATGITLDGSGQGNAANNNLFLQNTILSNAGYQIQIFSHANNNAANRNNIQIWPANNGLFNDDPATYDFARNWWSTTDELIIRSRLLDSGGVGVTFIPYRLGVVDTSMNGDTIAPAAPSAIKLDTSVAGQIAVSWTNPAVDEDSTSLTGFGGVKIYRLKNKVDTTQWAAALVWIAGPGDTRWVDTGDVPRETYYYRLTSRDTAPFVNESFFSDTVFSKVRTGIVLVVPPDSYQTNVIPVQFAWNDSSNSDTFTWQLSKSPAFTTIADSAVDSRVRSVVKSIPDQDTFYWRVISRDTFGNNETSATRAILLDTSANRVTLLAPADAHDTTRTLLLVVSWLAAMDSVGVDSYAVEVSRSSVFSSLFFSDTVDGLQTSDTLPGLSNDTYYWRVRAIDHLGNVGANSVSRYFVANKRPAIIAIGPKNPASQNWVPGDTDRAVFQFLIGVPAKQDSAQFDTIILTHVGSAGNTVPIRVDILIDSGTVPGDSDRFDTFLAGGIFSPKDTAILGNFISALRVGSGETRSLIAVYDISDSPNPGDTLLVRIASVRDVFGRSTIQPAETVNIAGPPVSSGIHQIVPLVRVARAAFSPETGPVRKKTTGVPVLRLQLSAGLLEKVELDQLIVYQVGDLAMADITAADLYIDEGDTPGAVDANDTFVKTASKAGTAIRFTGLPAWVTIPAGGSVNFLVTVDLDVAGADLGRAVKLKLQTDTEVELTGVVSQRPARVIGSPIAGDSIVPTGQLNMKLGPENPDGRNLRRSDTAEVIQIRFEKKDEDIELSHLRLRLVGSLPGDYIDRVTLYNDKGGQKGKVDAGDALIDSSPWSGDSVVFYFGPGQLDAPDTKTILVLLRITDTAASGKAFAIEVQKDDYSGTGVTSGYYPVLTNQARIRGETFTIDTNHVTFGVGPQNPPALGLVPGDTDRTVFQFQIGVPLRRDTALIDTIILTHVGRAGNTVPIRVELREDSGTVPGESDSLDTFLAAGVFSPKDTIVLTNFASALRLTPGETRTLIVVYDIADTPNAGDTLLVKVASSKHIMAHSAVSNETLTVAGKPITSGIHQIVPPVRVTRAAFSPDTTAVRKNATSVPVLRLQMSAGMLEKVELDQLIVYQVGTLGMADITKAELYVDEGGAPGAVDAGDTFVKAASKAGTALRFTGLPAWVTIPAGGVVNFLVTVDIGVANADLGQTIQLKLQADTDAGLTGVVSGFSAKNTGAPITGNSIVPTGELDIALGASNPAGKILRKGDTAEILQFHLTQKDEDIDVARLRLRLVGPLPPANIARVILYNDSGATPGKVDAGDRILDSGALAGDSIEFYFPPAKLRITGGGAGGENLLALVKISDSAASPESFSMKVGADDYSGTGMTSLFYPTVTDKAITLGDTFSIDTIVVTLIRPADGTDTNTATTDYVWIGTRAETYTWQLSKSPAFAMISDSVVDTRATSISKRLKDQDTFYWRVIGRNTLGSSETSAVRTILLDTSADTVTLFLPADGHETKAASFLARWNVLPDSSGIDSYAIEVSKSPLFTSMFFADTVDGALTGDTVSFVQSDSYFWRVRAIDNLGNAGALSPPRGFFVDLDRPPVLSGVKAAANLSGAETGVYLTWTTSPASDSAGYHIYRSTTLDSRISTRINASLIRDSVGYLDTTAVRGDTQFYYVVAVDLRNNFSDSSMLASAPNAAVVKLATISRARPGDAIAYSISVVNNGFAPARNVVLYDFRPSHSIFADSAGATSGWNIEYRVDSGANLWQSTFSDTADMIRFVSTKTLDPTLDSPADTLTLKVKIQ